MSKLKTNDGERILEMMNKFGKLTYEDQIYISGIVQGMFIQKQKLVIPSGRIRENMAE